MNFNSMKYLAFITAMSSIAGSLSASARPLRIGLSLPTQAEERWVRDRRTMVDAAHKAGVDLRVQITNNDAAKQVDQAENLIAQDIQVLILAPHDAESASVIVNKAKKAGVKVISYDRLVLSSEPDLYISFDNEKVGEVQGAYLTNLVPKGRYVLLSGSPTDSNARLYYTGAMKSIKPLMDRGDITIVMDQSVKDWQPAEAQKIVEQALTASQNKVDAILAPNDGTAGGAIQALVAQGLGGKVPVTGQDAELAAAVRIVQGTQSMTIFKDTRLLGQKAIELAVKLAKGEATQDLINGKINNKKVDVPSVLLPVTVVDQKNLDHVLIDSGYLQRDAIYKKAQESPPPAKKES